MAKANKKHKRRRARYSPKSKDMRAVAKERIEILFKQSDEVFKTNKGLANRYVTLARKIAMKAKVRIPSVFKRKFCKHCYKYLKQGVNVRVRTRAGMVTYYCQECKKFGKFRITKTKK